MYFVLILNWMTNYVIMGLNVMCEIVPNFGPNMSNSWLSYNFYNLSQLNISNKNIVIPKFRVIYKGQKIVKC